MVDTVGTTLTGNDNDDWEIAVDTGEFDKRHEQQEKARAANQEPALPIISSTGTDDSHSSPNIDPTKSNKPIRILKRPTSQSQLSSNNDVTSSASTAPAINNITNNSNLISTQNINSSATVPVISIIPRNQNKDPTNQSQISSAPGQGSANSSSQTIKPPIKTYEQRELEYRLARLRIMGEEESSTKDDDNDNKPFGDSSTIANDDTVKQTVISSSLATSSNARSASITSGPSPHSLQCHSTPGSYASNLYALNNSASNMGTIHFTPNNNNNNNNININNSNPSNLGTGPFSSPNFSQHYRGSYSASYSHMPPSTNGPRYSLPTAMSNVPYMTPTPPLPFMNSSSSYNYRPQPQPNMATNEWYQHQPSQTPFGTQQYGNPH